ncbi:MAG: hypothetical protein AAFV29_24000, partial [Myxococcota bacterium]
EDLDEEERDADQRPGFSLIDQLTAAPKVERNERLSAIEVVAFAGADIRSAHVLARPGEQYVLGRGVQGHRTPDAGHPGLRLVRLSGPGVAELEFTAAAKGQIRKQGRAADLDGLKKPEHASGRTNRFRVALKAGMDARIRFGQLSFHVRFVRPPKAVPNQERGKFDAFFPRAFGGAIAAHFILGFLLVLLGTETTFSSEASEAYAEITEQPPRDVEIKPEPEPEPPPPEVKPEPQPEPEPPPPPKKKKRRRKKVARRRQERTPPTKGATREKVKTAGVLGAMGKLNIRAPGRRSMVAAVSNIDAVKAPGGSNFRVNPLVGKTPTSDVQLGGGGGGKLLTRGSASLLKRGFGQLKGRKNGKVRGRVRRVSARRLKAQGSISREAVA